MRWRGIHKACTQHLKLVVRRLDNAFPMSVEDPSTWPLCSMLAPHCLSVAEHAEKHDAVYLSAAHVLNRVGVYLHERGERFKAKEVLKRTTAMAESASDPFNPVLAKYLGNLAQAQQELGQSGRSAYSAIARIFHQSAAFGEDSPQDGVKSG